MYKTRAKFVHSNKFKEKVLGDKRKNKILFIPQRLKEAYSKNKSIKGKVSEKVKGGFKVVIENYAAFCPKRQMCSPSKSGGVLKNKSFEFMVVDITDNSVILSRKKFIENQTLSFLKECKIGNKSVKGKIESIENYGAFVDLGGIKGLLHISKIASYYVEDIYEFVKIGDQVLVDILEIETSESKNKISLSLKKNLGQKIPNK